MHPEIRRYYEEGYDFVNYEGVSGVGTRVTHSRIEKELSSEEYFPTTLELGAAHGEHLRFVRHNFDNYIMMDLENFNLDLGTLTKNYSPNQISKISFLQGDAEAIPLDDSSVDRVLHTCLLHHLKNPERCVNETRRVLKSGGIYTAYLPCDRGLFYNLVKSLTTKRRIEQVLRENNFAITYDYMQAMEHPNHYYGLRSIIEEVFRKDSKTTNEYFMGFKSYNLNFFTVFNIEINK